MDFNPQRIDEFSGVAEFANDAQLLVRFKMHSELSQYKSKKAGIPIYDDIEIVEILNPGEKEPVIVAADQFHTRRFPKQYEAFKAGLEQDSSGTPLDHLFPASPSTVKQLKTFNIYSVQQLAQIADSAITQIPMGRTLVDKAKAYLANASKGQSHHAVEALQDEVAKLKAMIAEAGMTPPETPAITPEKRGPGRPRKEKEVA
jgi:hypothetical protein